MTLPILHFRLLCASKGMLRFRPTPRCVLCFAHPGAALDRVCGAISSCHMRPLPRAARQRLCDYIKRAEYTTLFDFPTKGILQASWVMHACRQGDAWALQVLRYKGALGLTEFWMHAAEGKCQETLLYFTPSYPANPNAGGGEAHPI